jgi:hypothetical protein
MPIQHEKKLRDLAKRTSNVLDLLPRSPDSAAQHVLRDTRTTQQVAAYLPCWP